MSDVTADTREALPLIRAQLASGGSCRLTVTGSSMLPFLRDGDAVVLAPIPPRGLRRGDIALYLRGNDCAVLHRVCGRDGGCYLFLGDAQTDIERVDPSRLIAVAESAVKPGGHGVSFSSPLRRALYGLWLSLRPFRPVLLRFGSRVKHFFAK